MSNVQRSAGDAWEGAVQDVTVWRAQQQAALTDQQRLVYQQAVEHGKKERRAMHTDFKTNRQRLIEEEFRKRLLHHRTPVLAMLPVRPKTQERILEEATHATDRQHRLHMVHKRQEHQKQCDRYLEIAARERQRKEEMAALVQSEFNRTSARDTEQSLSKATRQEKKRERFADDGRRASAPFHKSDYFTKQEAIDLLGKKVSKRTDYDHGAGEGREELQKGATGEVFRIEHVMDGAYEVSVAWGREDARRIVADYDKHLFNDDVQIVRDISMKR